MRHALKKIFRRKKSPEFRAPPDIDGADLEIIRKAKPFTMTGVERLFSVVQAVRYVVAHRIPGDLVECGVWKGGSMIAAAETLKEVSSMDRHLWLYDTFEGMSAPTRQDISLLGERADEHYAAKRDEGTGGSDWCRSPLDEVRRNVGSTGYPENLIHYVKGRVEETIPAQAPARIALLRLDTDWYESTRHELEHLFPRLAAGGVLIVDDYGYWKGCRAAVDEYFQSQRVALLLHRIDRACRVGVKMT